MRQAKISEIFLSYQGEGPYVGSRQLFVRFYGCNLSCDYCDTQLDSYKSFSKDALLSKIHDFEENYNELAITGGEPLLYADFLKGFLPLFKQYRQNKVYLETNGTLPEEMAKIKFLVDVVSMDFKLPSSGGTGEDVWEKHKDFIKTVLPRELIVKTVIAGKTTIDDIKKMVEVLETFKDKFSIVLQPVTPISGEVVEADNEMVSYFKGYIEKELDKDVHIIGQVHKCIGIR
ncbi:MAG: 7-carboxy-7-deazaguanine synthase QueE [Candidatus Omnitrophica bacterium]|nr:7-carboxy-7-deazaguanine synthase QueE [Candidatus Omnitrophota bacterium]